MITLFFCLNGLLGVSCCYVLSYFYFYCWIFLTSYPVLIVNCTYFCSLSSFSEVFIVICTDAVQVFFLVFIPHLVSLFGQHESMSQSQ